MTSHLSASATASPNPLSWLANGVLAIKPLANLAKNKARTMMIERAESIGVYWRDEVQQLNARGGNAEFSAQWAQDLAAVQNPDLVYPNYYVTSFHAYEEGNLGWQPAMEVEVAAKAVHARIWPEAGAEGDTQLRQSYHHVLKANLPQSPTEIVDLGCSVGMSTEALQATFPGAGLTGVDLSPYFLAVAKYRQDRNYFHSDQGGQPIGMAAGDAALNPSTLKPIAWHHAAAEATGLPDGGFDLVSACLVFHELPQSAAIAIIHEARRLLRPGGHLAIMDMNPACETFTQMPPFVLTLLKSTEPYLDEYFGLNFNSTFQAAGFGEPTIVTNSPRHHTVIAEAI
ncbi:MAG: class I SAM-dependent methyltransferase [Cyanobacteria bacterium]|nr:class I SAM-dependent methyltransferase [Cyanobacteriota bacterium]